MDYQFEERETLKEKPEGSLGFGNYYTDYMFIVDYDEDQGGFHDARMVPFGPIELDPASMVLHYAQETFEGLKAYKSKDGRILLFRPEKNAARFANSNNRMSMPEVPQDLFIGALEEFVKKEKDWIPTGEGESLYLRPYMFATEAQVGVHPAKSYKFMVIGSPVGAYYPEGVNPVKIWVEDEYVRAAPGGTGFTKCGGNYAGSLKAQEKAEEQGYTQVLWLDGVEKKYVEEVGSMNAFFVIDGEIYTAPIEGTVLPGVTRDSIIQLLKDWDIPVHEEHVAIEDLMNAAKEGRVNEAFGTGTAAVISPIGELYYKGDKAVIHDFTTGELTQKLYDTLTGIQWGDLEDPHGWTYEIKLDESE